MGLREPGWSIPEAGNIAFLPRYGSTPVFRPSYGGGSLMQVFPRIMDEMGVLPEKFALHRSIQV